MIKSDEISDLIEEADELIDGNDRDHDRADNHTDDAPQIEVIEDDESYIQSQRLRDIFDARQAVRKQRLQMKIHSIDNESAVATRKAKRVYRAAVENYLSEIRQIFLEDEQGKEVWFNLDFGTLKIPLPIQHKNSGRGVGRRVHQTFRNGKTKNLPVDDPLNYLFELPSPMAAEFEWIATTGGMGGGTSKYHETIRHEIGFDRLDTLVNEANDQLRKRGLDLSLDQPDDNSWEL